MSDYLSELGLNSEEYNNVQTEGIAEYSALEPGIYDAKIKNWANYISDKGASVVFIEYDVKTPNGVANISEYIATKSGDEKGNKVLDFGISRLKNRLFALGVNPADIKLREAKMKIGQTARNVKSASSLIGKKLKIAIRNEENEYNDTITERNYIFTALTANGENETDGKEALEKAKAFIEKSPLKKLRKTSSSPQQDTASASATDTAAPSDGW